MAPPPPPIVVAPRKRPGFLRLVATFVLIGAAVVAVVSFVTPAPKAMLVVQVRGINGAPVTAGRVVVNDIPAGIPGAPIGMRPGTAIVSFQEPGWITVPQSVTLARDATVTLTLTAREAPAHLSVVTTPAGATIRIAGRVQGVSPRTIDLPPGSYDLAVALPGHVGKVVPVVLGRGESRSVDVELALRNLPPPFERGVVSVETPLLARPAGNAPVVTMLSAATEVHVLGEVVADQAWLQLRSEANVGYVPATGVIEPWDRWAARNTANGPIDAVAPNLRLVIAGNAYPLFGVRVPDTGYSAAGLAQMEAGLAARLRGMQAQCVPHSVAAFLCKTQDGRDVAELYLLNGGAVVAEGAPAYYAEDQRVARETQKGLWAD